MQNIYYANVADFKFYIFDYKNNLFFWISIFNIVIYKNTITNKNITFFFLSLNTWFNIEHTSAYREI